MNEDLRAELMQMDDHDQAVRAELAAERNVLKNRSSPGAALSGGQNISHKRDKKHIRLLALLTRYFCASRAFCG